MKKFLHSLLILFMGINVAAVAQQQEAAEITAWDGSDMAIEIRRGDTLTFEYTAAAQGTLYVYADDQKSADYLTVGISGGVFLDGAYDENFKLEDTGFFDEDNQTGVHGKIELYSGEKLRFALTAPEDSYGKKSSFTLKSKFITGNMGSSSNPVELKQNQKATLATFKNSTESLDETHATYCKFTAPSDGVASIYTKQYLVYIVEEELFGTKDFTRVAESQRTNYEHEFVVTKDQSYIVAVPNSRFVDVTFKMTYDRLGLAPEFPIEISEFPVTLNPVKGNNYYRFSHELIGDNIIMEVAAAEGWDGVIDYMETVEWKDEVSTELTSDSVSGSAATFYKNVDIRFLLGDAVTVNFKVTDGTAAATLSLREPAAGESFETAVAATAGENTFSASGRDYWFAYTAEADAVYHFTTNGTLKHVNLVAGVELMIADNVYRFHKGETVYVCVSGTEESNTFIIGYEEIVAGDYCDNPIFFKLGEDITIQGRGVDNFHSFTAEENGFALFTSPGWSVHFRSECGGYRLDCQPVITEKGGLEEDDETYEVTYTYKLPVEAGQNYIVEVEGVSEDIVITTGFEAPVAGDVCATAIAIETLNDTIKLDYAFGVEKWYKLTADKSGYFTIYAKLGYAANMKTKVGSCDANETNAPTDNSHDNAYMAGYKAAKVYVEEGETLYIYTKTGSENDEVEELFGKDFYIVPTFAEPRPGEDVAVAIAVETGKEYEVMTNTDGYEQWYSYIIPAGKEMTATLSATVKFISNSLSFYKEDKTTSMSAYKGDYTQTNITNDDNVIIGKSYYFAPADDQRTIYIKVSTVNAMYAPVVWSIACDDNGLNTDVETPAVTHEAPVIYDLMGRRVENPGKGIYIINGVKRVIK